MCQLKWTLLKLCVDEVCHIVKKDLTKGNLKNERQVGPQEILGFGLVSLPLKKEVLKWVMPTNRCSDWLCILPSSNLEKNQYIFYVPWILHLFHSCVSFHWSISN